MSRTAVSSEGSRGSSLKRCPKLLVVETDYALEGILQRRIEHSVLCRDLNGYFSHVWSVHPFATLVTSPAWSPRFGRPVIHELAPCHTFIEGKVGRFAWLGRLFTLNFLLSQMGLFWQLRKLIRKERIDVIRVSSPLYVGLFGLALARTTKIPLVVRVGANHDKIYEATGKSMEPRLMRSRKVEKMVRRLVFRRADLVAGANQDNLNFALANGARPERSTLFRYGNLVDPRHFTAPQERESGDEVLRQLGVEAGKFLLYVGRLEPIKQPDHILEVLASLRRCGLDLKAVLAGEGRMQSELERRARALGLEEALILPGNVDQGRLASLYPAAAAVISPHTGRALAEAALGGAPVVAYDVDWQSELIETGKTGELVPYGDLPAMAAATKRLLADAANATKLGKALRKRALEILDPAKLNEHERREYDRLLSRRRC